MNDYRTWSSTGTEYNGEYIYSTGSDLPILYGPINIFTEQVTEDLSQRILAEAKRVVEEFTLYGTINYTKNRGTFMSKEKTEQWWKKLAELQEGR